MELIQQLLAFRPNFNQRLSPEDCIALRQFLGRFTPPPQKTGSVDFGRLITANIGTGVSAIVSELSFRVSIEASGYSSDEVKFLFSVLEFNDQIRCEAERVGKLSLAGPPPAEAGTATFAAESTPQTGTAGEYDSDNAAPVSYFERKHAVAVLGQAGIPQSTAYKWLAGFDDLIPSNVLDELKEKATGRENRE